MPAIKTVIYLDVLLLVNFLVAYFLLQAAGLLSSQHAAFSRMVCASGIASLSALILFAPELSYPAQILYKILTACAVVGVAFGLQGLRRFVTAVCWYAALNILLAGLCIAVILRTGTPLLQIISDVLDLARIESGRTDIERTQFDARDLCREVADSLRLQRRPGVELRVEEGLPEFPVTEYRKGLAQVLNNFTRNALKFTEKGSVTIGFRRIPGHIRFYVRDTGIGIAPEDRERIFERFVKLDTFTQGTGLGLSICKSIAEQLGGSVGVDSVAGEGSCFRIDIPAGE